MIPNSRLLPLLMSARREEPQQPLRPTASQECVAQFSVMRKKDLLAAARLESALGPQKGKHILHHAPHQDQQYQTGNVRALPALPLPPA